jgi:hypothetical protein
VLIAKLGSGKSSLHHLLETRPEELALLGNGETRSRLALKIDAPLRNASLVHRLHTSKFIELAPLLTEHSLTMMG